MAGVRVLDLSHVIAGPTASHYLALEGADVIKVEHPVKGESMGIKLLEIQYLEID